MSRDDTERELLLRLHVKFDELADNLRDQKVETEQKFSKVHKRFAKIETVGIVSWIILAIPKLTGESLTTVLAHLASITHVF